MAKRSSGYGFSITELLIAIGILILLVLIVTITIKPGNIVAKSRDSERLSDLNALSAAINLYLADGKNFSQPGPFSSTDNPNLITGAKNDGTGWLKGVDFEQVSSGPPIGELPIDPLNRTLKGITYRYQFGGDLKARTYELNGVLESKDNLDKMAKDGGTSSNIYEIGTDLTILP